MRLIRNTDVDDGARDGDDSISGPPGKATLVVEATWARRILELGLGAVQAIGCLLLVLLAIRVSPLLLPFAAILAFVSFQFFQRAFDVRPRLIVDSDGITDRTAAGSGPICIPWSEVLRVSGSWGGTIELEVKNPKWLRTRVGMARRVGMTLLGKRTFSVAPALLGISKSELQEQIARELGEFELRELGMKAEVPKLGDELGE